MKFNVKSLMLASMFLIAPLALTAQDSHTNTPSTTQPSGKHLTAEQLKGMMDSNKSIVLIDARSKPYFDGNLLPGAKWLPCDSTDDAITAALPVKDATIVVYCLNSHCPASNCLADKLAHMGYTNVYEFTGGIQDWIKQGFSTNKQQ
jgi:rhodanese-related sulfurtransferase